MKKIGIIAVAAAILGLVFFLNRKLPGSKTDLRQEVEVSQEGESSFAAASLEDFAVIPSEKVGRCTLYSSGAVARAQGRGFAEIRFYQRGGGTGIYTDALGGFVGKGVLEAGEKGEVWTLLLPTERAFPELCAVAFDRNGTRVAEKCLFNVFAQDAADDITRENCRKE